MRGRTDHGGKIRAFRSSVGLMEDMQQLGHTRSAQTASHLLQTPDTFVRTPLPGLRRANAVIHISPAGGARFTQYSVEFEAHGELAPGPGQRFVYILDGALTIDGHTLDSGGYAYLPPEHSAVISAATPSRAAVIEKLYEPLDPHSRPAALFGHERAVTPSLLMDDPGLEVRALIPDEPGFDFRVNTMRYEPGAALPAVESHVMEHGLLMLEGGGVYRLGDRWYPVTTGDFIWMAPFCPQWFGAIGKSAAKYLIYKDWGRRPR